MTVPRSQRFSAVHPCPACGRGKHNSWCYILSGGTAFWCGRASHFAGRPGLPRKSGWVHRLSTTAAPVAYVRPTAPAPADHSAFPALARRLACSAGQLEHLAAKLHLRPEAVTRFKPCWADAVPDPRPDDPHRHVIQGTTTPCRAPGVWLFPMYRPAAAAPPAHPATAHPRPAVVGFRVRTLGGDKYSIAGTDGDGLFIPTSVTLCRGGLLLAPEGPTSAAALCQLGFCAVGRPNNRAGVQYLRALIRWLRPARVVVFGDNDSRPNPKDATEAEWPGIDGAVETAMRLRGLPCTITCAMPPDEFKDSRAWVIAGAGVRDVHETIHRYRDCCYSPHHLTHHRPEGACA